MTVLELKDKRNKLMTDAAKLIQQPTVTTEHRSQFDAMIVDVDLIESDITRLERTAKFDSEQRAAGRPPRSQPGADARGIDDTGQLEKRAFTEFIRYGQASPEHRSYLRAAIETRDLGTITTGSVTGGGQLVPQAFYSNLIEAQKSWGVITTIVNTKKTDTGAPMKIAFANDTGNQLSVLGETAAVPEVDPALSGIISSTDKCTTGVIKVSIEELQDSAFDLDSWIRDSFGKRYWRGVSSMLTNGSSTGNVQPITPGRSVTLSAGSTTSLAYTDLVNIYSALDPAYVATATWSVNSATRGVLMNVKDDYGRPLLTSAVDGGLDYILGRPVVINQFQPNCAASVHGAILFGDFKQAYTFRSVGDLQIMRLNERYIDQGEVGFLGFARIGGFNTDAGTHPPRLCSDVRELINLNGDGESCPRLFYFWSPMLNLKLITPPVVEPVTLAIAKQHVRCDFSDDDTLIPVYITAARQMAEKYTRRAFFNQTWQLSLDQFPIFACSSTLPIRSRENWPFYSSYWDGITIRLPRPTCVSVISITYIDLTGTTQTLPSDSYYVDTTSEPARGRARPRHLLALYSDVFTGIRADYVCGRKLRGWRGSEHLPEYGCDGYAAVDWQLL